jgi:hypothetical protein
LRSPFDVQAPAFGLCRCSIGLARCRRLGGSGTDTSALREAVTVDGITQHQAVLESIANANPFEGIPTGATGTPGHEASVEYVVQKMETPGSTLSLG